MDQAAPYTPKAVREGEGSRSDPQPLGPWPPSQVRVEEECSSNAQIGLRDAGISVLVLHFLAYRPSSLRTTRGSPDSIAPTSEVTVEQ